MTVGWRGRRAAYLAIVGFAAVIFTFLGVNLLHDSKHVYNLSSPATEGRSAEP